MVLYSKYKRGSNTEEKESERRGGRFCIGAPWFFSQQGERCQVMVSRPTDTKIHSNSIWKSDRRRKRSVCGRLCVCVYISIHMYIIYMCVCTWGIFFHIVKKSSFPLPMEELSQFFCLCVTQCAIAQCMLLITA